MSANEAFVGLEFLVGRLKGDAMLASLAPGGVWDSMAPQGTAQPFIIVAYQAGTDTTTNVGVVRLLSLILYQVKAVGPATMATAVAAAAAQADAVLGGKNGLKNIATADGFIAACYREQPLMYPEPQPVNGVLWTNIGGLQRLEIEVS
jgi:hypothetical protein